MIDPQVLAFIGVAALLTITPGADTMLVMRSVLARGKQAGFITTAGICSGLFLHATLSALGLSLLLVRSATAFEVVKLLGACYLIFLGIQSLRQSSKIESEPAAEETKPQRKIGNSFLEGLLNNALNPKVSVFYLAFLPQFINPSDPVLGKSILLASIHFVMGIAWLSLLTLLVGQVRTLFLRPSVRRRLEQITGGILILFGVRLALEHR